MSGRWPKGRELGEAKLCDRLTLGDSGAFMPPLVAMAGLIHCLLDGRGCFGPCCGGPRAGWILALCARGPVGMVGLIELEGPDGGAQASPAVWEDGMGRSWRSSMSARGPVGGAFGVSEAGGGRTEPNMGAEGASGGVMAFVVEADKGSLTTEPCRSSFGRTLRSVVSRGSRGGFGNSSRSSLGPSRKRGSG